MSMITIVKSAILTEKSKPREVNGGNIIFFSGKNKYIKGLYFFKLTYRFDAILIKTFF